MADFRGTERTSYTQDGRGFQWLRAGIPPVSPAAVPATISAVYVRQQQPESLQPRLFPGVRPAATRAPITDTILGRQEVPLQHPRPYLLRGVPIVDALMVGNYNNSIFTRQAVPWAWLVHRPMLSHSTMPSTSEGPWEFGYTVQ